MRDLPAHHHHEHQAEEQKRQRRDTVLDADDFMVRRENIFAPEPRLGMRMAVAVIVVPVVIVGMRLILAVGRKMLNVLVNNYFTLSKTINVSNNGK
jgi:hypothetical protein